MIDIEKKIREYLCLEDLADQSKEYWNDMNKEIFNHCIENLPKEFEKRLKDELIEMRDMETLEKITRIVSESEKRKETKEEKFKRISFEINKSTEYWKTLNRRKR